MRPNSIILPLKSLNIKRYPDGNLMQGYGENCQFYTPNFWNEATQTGFKCHNGCDFYTFENDPVLAVCDGTILDAGWKTSRGNGIWLISESYWDNGILRADMFCFFHMSAVVVKTGDKVKQGQVIGYEGNTGDVISGNNPYWGNAPAHKGVHLHFGYYPLIQGIDEQQRAFWVNASGFILEFRFNQEDGAVDPMPLLEAAVTPAEPVVTPVTPSEPVLTPEQLMWYQIVINSVKSLIQSLSDYIKGRNTS